MVQDCVCNAETRARGGIEGESDSGEGVVADVVSRPGAKNPGRRKRTALQRQRAHAKKCGAMPLVEKEGVGWATQIGAVVSGE